jgi:uncharacterized protein YjbI with pentapeptide repeats
MSKAEKPKSSWGERRKTIKYKWLVPFIFPEWICERLSVLLKRWAFLEVLEYAGRLTILIAVIFYFMEADERRKARHYQAWQIINAAQGQLGSGGRVDALQDLIRDNVSLTYIDLSNAFLMRMDLENAGLSRADFSGADLWQANLSKTKCQWTIFSGTILHGANLSEAILSGADLSGARLTLAHLSRAILYDVNLSGANVFGAKLSGANLHLSDLSDADLNGANLQYSNLSDIKNWRQIRSIELANIHGVKNPPLGFVEWAKQHGAVGIESEKEWRKLLYEKKKWKIYDEPWKRYDE